MSQKHVDLEKLILAYQSSSLTLLEFCKAHSLKSSTFKYHYYKSNHYLRRRRNHTPSEVLEKSNRPKDFYPVNVSQSLSPSSDSIIFEFNGFGRVLIPLSHGKEILLGLVQELRS